MPDLYIPESRPTRTKRRAFRIEIENNKSGNKSLAYHQEDILVFTDDGACARPWQNDYVGSLVIPFSELATTIHEIDCPVTGQKIALSGAAIAMWLEHDYVTRAQADLEAKHGA